MSDHIVIIGSKVDSAQHLKYLIKECRANAVTAGREIVLISESFPSGLPECLIPFDVKYVNGRGANPSALDRAGILTAGIIVLLAWEEDNPQSDGHAFDILHRIREANQGARIVAECVEDTNRKRLLSAGANMVIRPVRAYPEMLIGGLLNPGSTDIFENLFTAEGENIVCREERISGTWAQIVAKHLSEDRGTPIAYRDAKTNRVVTSPRGSAEVTGNAVYLLTV